MAPLATVEKSREGVLRELASGVDALYLSGRAQIPESTISALAAAKEAAGTAARSVPFELGDEVFHVAASGLIRYRYKLEHEHGLVGMTESERLPAVRIQPRAEFLHAVGPVAVVEWFREVVGSAVGHVEFSVSRIDLHADWQGWDLDGDDRRRFVCRATDRNTFEEREDLSGIGFGKRSTNTVLARIYDKTREVEKKGHDWWTDKWGDRFDAARSVIRTEFEFGREGLRSFQVSRPEEAFEAMGDLWRYATTEWLTYRTPTADGTRSRWPVAPEWEAVQQASLRSEAVGLARIRAGARRGELRTLLPPLNGYLVGFAACIGTTTIEQTLAALGPHLRDFEHSSLRRFEDRVEERRGAA